MLSISFRKHLNEKKKNDKNNLLSNGNRTDVFSRERFTTVTAYRGFVTKSQLLETLFTQN